MSLPQIKQPKFTLKLAEMDKPLSVRPMLVSEHKSIQQANDIYSKTDVADVISRITESCTNNEINADKTPQYLLEYVFLNIYINSVQSIMSSVYQCRSPFKDDNGKNKIDEETGDTILCDNDININIPLNEVKIIYDNKKPNETVKLDESTEVKLKQLSIVEGRVVQDLQLQLYNLVQKYESEEDESLKDNYQQEINELKDKIKNKFNYYTIDKVIHNGSDINISSMEENEVVEWINQCPNKLTISIEDFLNASPTIGFDMELSCPKCGNKTKISLRGLNDFL